MKKIMLCCVAFLMLISAALKAQTIQAEKTYEISGKAKRGTLAQVEYINSNYVLYYVTKSTARKMKFEIYTFDKEYNFVSKVDDELEFEQAKTKYKWFKFKKEEYVVEGLSVEPNMMGTLVLKKKRVTHTFDPIFWGYRKKVEVLDKVKPKTEDGNKLYYYTHAEDDNTGDVYILVGEKAKGAQEMKSEPDKQYKKYHVMRFNQNCDLVSDLALDFQYPVMVAFKGQLPDAEVSEPGVPSMGNLCFVFAPTKIKGLTKEEDPDKNNFKYISVDNSNKKVAEFNFKTQTPQWRIDDIIYDGLTGDVFFYGPCAEGKDAYFDLTTAGSTKLKAVQLMKVKNNQLGYLTLTNLDEFEAKLKTPPSQKKSPAYKGKKFKIVNYTVAQNGDFFVTGQNFDPVKDGIKYQDIVAFHFDNNGVLRSQYGLDVLENGAFTGGNFTPQQFIMGEKPESLYWMVREVDGVNSAGRVLTYARIGKVSLANATVSDFKILGANGKKPDYYIDPNFPFLTTENDNTLVFFGSDKKEKNIWFCRVLLD